MPSAFAADGRPVGRGAEDRPAGQTRAVAALAHLRHVGAVGRGRRFGLRGIRRQPVVDLLVGLGDAAEAVHHARRQRQLDGAASVAAGRRQLAQIGNDRGQVVVAQTVVVLAGHQPQRPARRRDAVADAAHPVELPVGGDIGVAGGDIRPGQVRALAVVDQGAAAAVVAVAVGAAARLEQVAAARDRGLVAAVGHRPHVDVHGALRPLRPEAVADGDGRHRGGQQHDDAAQREEQPAFHGVPRGCGFELRSRAFFLAPLKARIRPAGAQRRKPRRTGRAPPVGKNLRTCAVTADTLRPVAARISPGATCPLPCRSFERPIA